LYDAITVAGVQYLWQERVSPGKLACELRCSPLSSPLLAQERAMHAWPVIKATPADSDIRARKFEVAYESEKQEVANKINGFYHPQKYGAHSRT
jgi:hypothetical protein